MLGPGQSALSWNSHITLSEYIPGFIPSRRYRPASSAIAWATGSFNSASARVTTAPTSDLSEGKMKTLPVILLVSGMDVAVGGIGVSVGGMSVAVAVRGIGVPDVPHALSKSATIGTRTTNDIFPLFILYLLHGDLLDAELSPI